MKKSDWHDWPKLLYIGTTITIIATIMRPLPCCNTHLEPVHVDKAIDVTAMEWCTHQKVRITTHDNETGKPEVFFAVTERDYTAQDGPITVQEGWF